jgi:hypothetical protein
MHSERKFIFHSHKHSFTLYPSLSPYSWTDRMTDRETTTPAAHGLEEPRVNLRLKENLHVIHIILLLSLISELKFYKLCMFCYVFCLVALLKERYLTNYFTN